MVKGDCPGGVIALTSDWEPHRGVIANVRGLVYFLPGFLRVLLEPPCQVLG